MKFREKENFQAKQTRQKAKEHFGRKLPKNSKIEIEHGSLDQEEDIHHQ